MATIRKRGDLQWEVQIRRKGFPPQSRTFSVKAEADSWAAVIESEMARGVFVSRTEAENTTLSEALDRYEREISSLKKGAAVETIRIRYWKNHPLSARPLAGVRSSDLSLWRDGRLNEVSPSTVNREMNLISHVFTICIKEWGMASLVNPVSQIRRPRNPESRERRLQLGELEKILEHTDSPMLGPVVRFALETGMRRGEIVAMQWEHVDAKKRTLRIPETKTGKSRTVPLTTEALRILNDLPRRLDGSIWGMTDPHTMTRAFERACKRAKISDLTFHDLRHEATSRFFEKGLNPMQVAAITGHKTLQMLKRYTHLRAEDLVGLLA